MVCSQEHFFSSCAIKTIKFAGRGNYVSRRHSFYVPPHSRLSSNLAPSLKFQTFAYLKEICSIFLCHRRWLWQIRSLRMFWWCKGSSCHRGDDDQVSKLHGLLAPQRVPYGHPNAAPKSAPSLHPGAEYCYWISHMACEHMRMMIKMKSYGCRAEWRFCIRTSRNIQHTYIYCIFVMHSFVCVWGGNL